MQFGRKTVPFSSGWSRGRSSVVFLLIALNVVAYLFQWGTEQALPKFSEQYLALSREGLAHGYYWQLVSYMFVHQGILHLLVNCVGLYFAGREVELICGAGHLLGIYFLGGIFGGLAQLLRGDVSVCGASAGVCAVLMAFTTILPELEITLLLFFVLPLRMRAKWLGSGLIVTSILFAFTSLGGKDVAHIAHLGGAMTGWFYVRRLGYGGAFWFQRIFRDRRRARERRERMNPTQFISEEIDPILDKISKEGIHSLTREERRVLELGRDKIEKKTRT